MCVCVCGAVWMCACVLVVGEGFMDVCGGGWEDENSDNYIYQSSCPDHS